MSRSLRVRREFIEKAKLAVKRNDFPNQRALAEEVGMALATISNFLTGKLVDRATFVELCDRLSLDLEEIATFGEETDPESLVQPMDADRSKSLTFPAKRQDWGEAIDVSSFFGRSEELAAAKEWIVQDKCRLVMLLGMGGIGKTSLSIKLAEQLQDEFEFLIWRSLRNAPPVEELLADLLHFFSNQQEDHLPNTIDGQIAQVMKYLRDSRCLLVLDNVESILSSNDRAGAYRPGYEGYGQFLSCVGETRHQSCLVLTSREKPRGLSAKAGINLPIRSLRLNGLEPEAGQSIFHEKGFAVSSSEGQALIDHYAGNPLALQIVATTIQEVFDGNVAQFLDQGAVIFGDISDLLDQQFVRLSALEHQVMYWLAINRESMSLTQLRDDIVPTVSQRLLLEAIESLQLRSLIEKSGSSFTQQPVVMEYVTEQLIDLVSAEIEAWNLDKLTAPAALFNCCALIKAQTKDYLRNTQIQLILKPIAERWLSFWGGIDCIAPELPQLLDGLRSLRRKGYAGGNLLNLCWQLHLDLSGSDFSRLTIRQAYLQGMNLHRVNFAGADLTQSVFTQSLGGILCAAFSPDGTLLATGMDCDVCLWHMVGHRQFKVFKGHKGWVQSIAFSPDGTLLASGSSDQTIRLWNLQTGQCLKTMRGHTSWVQSIAFSLDGELLASGSNDQTVRLWNIRAGVDQCLKVLSLHTRRILSVAFCLDRQTLISSSEDQTVRRWDIDTGECLQVLNIDVNWVMSIGFSPDGKILATGSDGKAVKFWNLASGKCVGTLDYSAQVWAVSYAPTASSAPQQLATGSEDGMVKIWDVQTGECQKTLQGHRDRVWLVAFNPDGQTLMSMSEDQTMKFWNITTGQCLKTLEAYSNWILSVAFSPDGQSIASSSQDQRVRVWDVTTGKSIVTLQGHTNLVASISFAPQGDGHALASGSDDRAIKLWDYRTGECLGTICGHTDWVQSVTFSPDGQLLASGSRDQTIKLWDWRTGECLQTFIGHSHRVKSVAFNPQGTMLASGSDDQTIRLWDVQTGDCLQTIQGHCDWVLSIAFSPCGALLASSSGDCTIKLWNVQRGECLNTLQGHTHRIRSIAFSPDGHTLASGSDDQTVKLWDVSAGRLFNTLEGHQKAVWSVAFSPDGRLIASGSGDETIKLWVAETGECLRTLRIDRPYEEMNIQDAVGLTSAQRAILKALGAVEQEVHRC